MPAAVSILRKPWCYPISKSTTPSRPNGDKKNDIFTVSCIEAYENNIVRIYNRAGSLVYQHRGYDNQTVFFDGFGNHGPLRWKKKNCPMAPTSIS